MLHFVTFSSETNLQKTWPLGHCPLRIENAMENTIRFWFFKSAKSTDPCLLNARFWVYSNGFSHGACPLKKKQATLARSTSVLDSPLDQRFGKSILDDFGSSPGWKVIKSDPSSSASQDLLPSCRKQVFLALRKKGSLGELRFTLEPFYYKWGLF